MSPPFPAAVLAAARDAAKAHLRLSGTSEDAVLERHAAAALTLAEAFTGLALIVRPWTSHVAASGEWRPIDVAPVRAITAVEGVTANGGTMPLGVGDHGVDIDAAGEARVRVARAPDLRHGRVTVEAGLVVDWAALPPPIAHGVIILTAHLFEARHGDRAPPAAVSALWRPWRRLRVAA
jgi:uncharacterized phiE125 gp8 family phage protein